MFAAAAIRNDGGRHMGRTEEEKYTDAQRRATEQVIATLAPRAPGLYAIAVSGSGSPHIYTAEATALGKAIAEAGYDLLTGGLKGVMFDVTQGFVGANSGMKAVGIIPKGKEGQAKEVRDALPGVLQVQTDLPGERPDGEGDHSGPSSRNRVLISIASKVVLMPGGVGSAAEAELARRKYQKPVVAYDPGKGRAADDEFRLWRQVINDLEITVVQSLNEVKEWLGRSPEPTNP